MLRYCLTRNIRTNVLGGFIKPNPILNNITNGYYQSRSMLSTSETSSMTDEEVDKWLESIQDLRSQFKQSGFNPELDLAPPGKGKLDLLKESNQINSKTFKPTELQLNEWESLKGVPLPKRQDPVLQQITNIIMRDGKKQIAERFISRALYLVFLQTRKDPIELLKNSLDELAPLMIVKTFNTGIAKASIIPVPLSKRQRTRIAWKWVIDASKNRASSDFAVRLAEEIVAVSKGLGSAFDRRDQIHKTAIAHRSYIKLK
ncbi:similar to Saccharomyces cerevisiae YJR113C RSM7 Mitochondrial ribosomal protein of the small subunit, has similarity to E. coli S7 ribosomal protein [Maudiozyma saulgeensis]|uniref:Small ribosomal subunit protein uS7m n=1 Tax=Maudiozyma saulgeensis TaxID=1789683 RepID=A0A1X7R634_9SACH|nr:similar to Saccharomyces cerevisiae YJR113C RSM7 Mitochondrial ribosomal protein of the small subunit, has similarity to E. coli S7 ribosomal protein [Kazachstania saulgeensis]